ncbi:ornithine cyclodeaminase [Rhodobacteraceae bacterium WD3A24]|nr:ornithine cyclodeaminase [Rhodobacteraceae bacterium WD3A24]
MTISIIGAEAEAGLDWLGLCDAFARGHEMPRAEIADSFLYRGDDTLLSRSAWISGMGMAVKTATLFPANPAAGLATVNGGVTLYSDTDGRLEAVVDFHLVTKWKTAGDSLYAARLLARPDSRAITIIGAGNVARSMIEAYRAAFPSARFTVWNRTPEAAERLADSVEGATAASDIEAAVAGADIVCTTTMTRDPVLHGAWLRPGQHVDLIGAFRPDTREADDDVLRRARLFVDSRATTLDHIGELRIPLVEGVIARDDVIADFYDIAAGHFRRGSDDEITVCKNGGGAHLDLMTARYIQSTTRGR